MHIQNSDVANGEVEYMNRDRMSDCNIDSAQHGHILESTLSDVDSMNVE